MAENIIPKLIVNNEKVFTFDFSHLLQIGISSIILLFIFVAFLCRSEYLQVWDFLKRVFKKIWYLKKKKLPDYLKEGWTHGMNLEGYDLRKTGSFSMNRLSTIYSSNCSYSDFRNCNYSTIIPTPGMGFQFCDLRNADMRNGNFSRARFDDADLKYADLRGANFERARLNRANLTGAKLKGILLFGAQLVGQDKMDLVRRGAIFTELNATNDSKFK